jgi:hypothetical protein
MELTLGDGWCSGELFVASAWRLPIYLLLKFLVLQDLPDSDDGGHEDSGMPSAHACDNPYFRVNN